VSQEKSPKNFYPYASALGKHGHIQPFRVLERRMFDTYRLAEPDGTPLKTLVHRDRMKRAQVREEIQGYWYHPTKDELNGLRGE